MKWLKNMKSRYSNKINNFVRINLIIIHLLCLISPLIWIDTSILLLEKLRTIQKKMQSLEGQYDDCTEQVFEVGIKLEQKEKVIRKKLWHLKIKFIHKCLRSILLLSRLFYIDRLSIALRVMLGDSLEEHYWLKKKLKDQKRD